MKDPRTFQEPHMPDHKRAYTSATVGVQRGGEGHVVVTLYATRGAGC